MLLLLDIIWCALLNIFILNLTITLIDILIVCKQKLYIIFRIILKYKFVSIFVLNSKIFFIYTLFRYYILGLIIRECWILSKYLLIVHKHMLIVVEIWLLLHITLLVLLFLILKILDILIGFRVQLIKFTFWAIKFFSKFLKSILGFLILIIITKISKLWSF